MSAFEGWAVVELLGHRVRYGRVTEVTMFGEAFCRIEIPTDPPTIEHYGIREASEASIRAIHVRRPRLTSGEAVVDDSEWDGTCSECGADHAGPCDDEPDDGWPRP